MLTVAQSLQQSGILVHALELRSGSQRESFEQDYAERTSVPFSVPTTWRSSS